MSVSLGRRLPHARGRGLSGIARRASSARVRGTVAVGSAAVVIGVLAWPMLLTSSGLGGDWEHHLWYVWQQSLAIRANGSPSLFLSTPYSVLYPQYAFYGGTINAIAGALSLALGGSPIAAYVLTYVLAFAAAYGGWCWLARAAGLGRWPAQAPALLFVTSACYLTLVYGQGDWAEFIAVSMIPLIVAAGAAVLRAEQLRLLPAVVLAAGSVVFFGSHDLTVLWASTIAIVVTGALLVCVPQVRRMVRPGRVLRVAALVIPGGLVNAWFLLPTIAYASHTKIGSSYGAARETLLYTMHLVSFDHLFTLTRASTPAGVPDYPLSLPTLAIAWVLVSIALLLALACHGAWMRILAICAAATAAVTVLMTHSGLLLALPRPYTILQFSYRLEGYVLIGVTAAVLAVLVIARSGPRRLRLWSWTLLPVLVLSAIGAVQQVDAYPHTPLPRADALTGLGEVFAETYNDYTYAPLSPVPDKGLPRLAIAPSEIHDDRASVALRARPGQLVDTNIGGGPDLLHITGARVVGRDSRYQLVLALGSGASVASTHPRTQLASMRVSISPAQSLPVVLGRLLTLLGAVVLAVELAIVSARAHLRARSS